VPPDGWQIFEEPSKFDLIVFGKATRWRQRMPLMFSANVLKSPKCALPALAQTLSHELLSGTGLVISAVGLGGLLLSLSLLCFAQTFERVIFPTAFLVYFTNHVGRGQLQNAK